MARSDNKYNPTKPRTVPLAEELSKSVAETIHDTLNALSEVAPLKEEQIVETMNKFYAKVAGADVQKEIAQVTVYYTDDSVLRIKWDFGEDNLQVQIESGTKLNIPVLETANKLH